MTSIPTLSPTLRQMTNEIAFALGRFDEDIPGRFYDIVRWSPNVEGFRYAHFFDWSLQGLSRSSKDGYERESWSFWGNLRESEFKTLEHKRAYVKGSLSQTAFSTITPISITIRYANSLGTRDRTAKWIHEILSGRPLDNHPYGVFDGWKIDKEEEYMIPICASLTLTAKEEAIAYLIS